jgi:hypothetical protein
MENAAAPAAGGDPVGVDAVASYPPYPPYFFESGMVYNPMHGMWQEPVRDVRNGKVHRVESEKIGGGADESRWHMSEVQRAVRETSKCSNTSFGGDIPRNADKTLAYNMLNTCMFQHTMVDNEVAVVQAFHDLWNVRRSGVRSRLSFYV